MNEKEIQKILDDAYFAYRKNLISEMYRYTHDYDLAEDCVQDAFCVLHTKLSEGTHVDDIQSFVFSVAKNYARIYSEWHALELCIEDVPSADKVLLDEDLDTQIINMENEELIFQGMKRLSPLNRRLFALRYLNGMNYAEIGRKVGMSSEAVRKGLARIQKQIKNEMLYDERGEVRLCFLTKIRAVTF